MSRARRLVFQDRTRSARRAFLAVCLLLAPPVAAQTATTEAGEARATFSEPTFRYGHGIMGDLPEWGRLCLEVAGQGACVTLPQASVFEDMAPRLHDLDRDGAPEAIAVESTFTEGAALVVYRLDGNSLQRIATPHIGTRNRWLAPAGIADLDGDGFVELAYVDRPHLAKTLRVWRYRDNALEPVAILAGLTNHRIGEEFITGGVRDCGAGPEIITADGSWKQVLATRLVGSALEARVITGFTQAAVKDALACR